MSRASRERARTKRWARAAGSTISGTPIIAKSAQIGSIAMATPIRITSPTRSRPAPVITARHTSLTALTSD